MSGGNALNLCELHAGMDTNGTGNSASARGFEQFVEWVDDLHSLARDGDVFENNMLESFRVASQPHVDGKGSLSVKGLVFSVSESYFDPTWNMSQKTVCIVSPDLLAPFSIRVRDTVDLSYGFYEFGHVKPVLLTNRLHRYAHSTITKMDIADGFEEWDFISSTIRDLDYFDCTIETEHYCEVPIYNDKRQRTLGAVLTISGQVTYISGSIIKIKSVTCGKECQFQMAGNMCEMDTDHFEGKYVKALIVHRYHEIPYDENTHRESELFVLRKTTMDEAERHDVVGHIRVRKTASIEDLNRIFGNLDFKQITGIEVRAGRASIPDVSNRGDPNIDKYLDTMKRIRLLRELRLPIEGPLHTPEDVLDPEKMSEEYLARNGHVVDILSGLIKAHDFDMLSSENLDDIKKNISRSKYNMLVKSDRIRDTEIMTATESGIAIAHIGKKTTIIRIIEGKDVVFIPELENQVTPTLLCRHLEKNGYKIAYYKGTKFDLMWEKPDASGMSCREEKIEEMYVPVLKAMAQSTSSLHFDALKGAAERNGGKFEFSAYSLRKLMNFLVGSKMISMDGRSYQMSTGQRVLLFLKNDRDWPFSLETIQKNVRIPRVHKPNQPTGMSKSEATHQIQDALSGLVQNNEAIEIVTGYWQVYSNHANLEEQRDRAIKRIMRKRILKTVNRQHVLRQVLVDRLDHAFRDICRGNGWRRSARELLDKSIQDLLNEGLLDVQGDRIVQVSGS